MIAKAFIGVDGPDTIRYARKRRTVTEAKNTEIDLGDFAVYTTKLGIGVTYQVKIGNSASTLIFKFFVIL